MGIECVGLSALVVLGPACCLTAVRAVVFRCYCVCRVVCCSLLGCVCSLCVARLFCLEMLFALFCFGLWVGWDVWFVRMQFGQWGVVLL